MLTTKSRAGGRMLLGIIPRKLKGGREFQKKYKKAMTMISTTIKEVFLLNLKLLPFLPLSLPSPLPFPNALKHSNGSICDFTPPCPPPFAQTILFLFVF